MSLYMKCGDNTIHISAEDSCCNLYQLAADQFSVMLADRKFVLYYIHKRELHVVPNIAKSLQSQQLRIRKAHDTLVHVLSDEIFQYALPEENHAESVVESRAETILPQDKTEDWVELMQSIVSIPSFDVLQAISPNLQPDDKSSKVDADQSNNSGQNQDGISNCPMVGSLQSNKVS